jgi:P-type conjugative transfer protein TrbJ
MGTAQRLSTLGLGIVLLAGPVRAYVVPVEDLAALPQHILTVAQTAKSNINEAMLIKQQFDQYLSMLQNLKRIPASMVEQLQNAMRDYRNLLTTAEGLSYNLQAIEGQFAALKQAGIQVNGVPDLAGLRATWNKRMMETATTAVKVQAIEQEQERDQARVGTALSMSNSAEGNLDVTQASNELLAVLAKQQSELLALQAAQGRVEALHYGKLAAQEEAAGARMEEWLRRDPAAIPNYRPPGQTSGGLPMPRLQ